MTSVDLFLNYILRSNVVTWAVLTWLSIYFITTFTILFSRWTQLSDWEKRERSSLESIMMGSKNVRDDSILRRCTSSVSHSPDMLKVCKNVAEKNATVGLSWLSVIASTSPFIGLFGTVVSILETFGKLGSAASASLGVIAPAISEALIVTAAGIFVAIPAYSFHILLKRKAYEVLSLVERQAEIVASNAKAHVSKSEHDQLG
ncbi:MAG: MotA/TolQ/ExbB proton channel family protein [Campylobacterales bacterium]|nr:MotA/TolQ/ExbB proton channel family protein [Campylobacterales bacterium]